MGKKAAAAPAAPPPEDDPPEEVEEEEKLLGKESEGEFLFGDGSRYKGQYVETGAGAVLHGDGELHAGPELFEGRFEHGLYKSGRFSSCNGAVYSGSFRDNRFHGLGEYTWPDGRTYRGTWQDGKMHGKGEFQNFVVGQQIFSGFALLGEFNSGPAEQEEARRAFLAEYEAACIASASSALRDLAAKTGSKGAPRRYAVPSDTVEPNEPVMVERDRASAGAVLSGPCAEAAAVPRAGVKALAAGLEEGTEAPLRVVVFADAENCDVHFPAQLLRLPQLQIRGQAVEFAPPVGAEEAPGSVRALVLVNISSDYDFAKARWKVAFIDSVPPAPTE